MSEINYYNKYIKIKNKYLLLKNILNGGGIINKPKYFHPKIKDQKEIDALYRDIEIITTDNINIMNPYIDSEITHTGTMKHLLYNKTKVFAEMPPIDQPYAYIGEHSRIPNEDYCVRKPYYPPPNLRIVSYNVHNFVKQCPRPIGKSTSYSLDTIMKLKPDIFFLQEITPEYEERPDDNKENATGGGNFKNLVDFCNKHGYTYNFIADTHYSTEPNALDSTRPYFMLCNAIFSKYRMLENKSIGLGNNRICIHSIIDFEIYYISCYNVHIEFNGKIMDEKNKIKYKYTQINKLAKYIYNSSLECDKKYIDKPIYYILGGDFNNTIDDIDLFKPITSIMKNLNPILSSDVGDNMDLYSAQNTERVLDMFFIGLPSNYECNMNYYIIPDNNSDHYPILLDFLPYPIV